MHRLRRRQVLCYDCGYCGNSLLDLFWSFDISTGQLCVPVQRRLHRKHVHSLCCWNIQVSHWRRLVHKLRLRKILYYHGCYCRSSLLDLSWSFNVFHRSNLVSMQRRLHGKRVYTLCSREVQVSHRRRLMHRLQRRQVLRYGGRCCRSSLLGMCSKQVLFRHRRLKRDNMPDMSLKFPIRSW